MVLKSYLTAQARKKMLEYQLASSLQFDLEALFLTWYIRKSFLTSSSNPTSKLRYNSNPNFVLSSGNKALNSKKIRKPKYDFAFK